MATMNMNLTNPAISTHTQMGTVRISRICHQVMILLVTWIILSLMWHLLLWMLLVLQHPQ